MHRIAERNPRRILADNQGSTPVEYALLAGLVAVTLVGALNLLGRAMAGALTNVQAAFG